MRKQNCWEVIQCGREPGGEKVDELDVCWTALDVSAHGINGGINGGRICWAIAGTSACGTTKQDYIRQDIVCERCRFYEQVVEEEGISAVQLLRPGRL